ncbi:hypothetical protein VTG60DRAFT_3598 [Thermothelomyces hinnuleus]
MEPADLPPKQRATSYADAVRGHKVFSPKSKPEGPKLAENALPLKKSSVIKEPRGVAQKQPQKKGTNLAQEKGSMPVPKDSQQNSSQAKQPRKDSHLKSSYAKTQDVREGQVTPQFSYAEAIKGKTLLRTPQLTGSEGEHEAGPASPAPSNVPIPESPPEASPSSQCKQPDDGIESSNKTPGDVVAIMDQSESKRRKMAEDRGERQARLIFCHDLGLISLWESQYEWDVLVTCGKYSWRLHHDILCRESEWFKARLPPKDPNGGYE